MKLVYSALAREQIRRLSPEVKSLLKGALEELAREPYLGKPLQRELTGYFSLRARRYRVIYQINTARKEIHVVRGGHRSRVYESNDS